MNKTLLALSACTALSLHAYATDWVDWDRIEHWAGDPSGANRAALVIDFQDDDRRSLVWGYRWNGTASGEDMLRAVASQSSALTVLTQYTGSMGSTINGLGISSGRDVLNYLEYDFDEAAVNGAVSFGYFSPNTSMGQDTAPGYETVDMIAEAIDRAKTTGIIDHPLNAMRYGYPAYDYDFWKIPEDTYSIDFRWRAAWYDGYWSYWIGSNDYDMMGYSGLGMSSVILSNNDVNAWKFISFNGDKTVVGDGDLNEHLNYDMADYAEAMHEPAEVTPQPVDFDKVDFYAGQGDKYAAVVIQFNDGQGPENLVYGYRWSGGWDDSFATVLQNIANADKRMTVTTAGNKFTITYDSDHDGKLGTNDHTSTAGEWTCYVKRVIDDGFEKVNGARWLNPGAVLVLAHNVADVADLEFPYMLYRPALDSEQILTMPESVEYALADEDLLIPLFIQRPATGSVAQPNFVRDSEITSVTGSCLFSRYMGKVGGYKNFKPVTGSIKARVYYTPADGARAYVFSNDCRVSLKNPERPIAALAYPTATVDARLNRNVDNQLQIIPADATYTKISYTTSNSRVATVNATTGVVKTTTTAGDAVISAAYSLDAEIAASYSLTSELKVKADDVTFDCVGDDGAITLTPKEMAGLMPVFTPADPDLNTVTVTLEGNGTGKTDYIATTYMVNLWDTDNNMTRMPELSGHREGTCKLTVKTGDGLTKEFAVNVVDREREGDIDYNTGTIMLNEEWFGHTNGGLNWISPDYEYTWQAYERENPGMSFGATTCFAIVYGGKLVVSSKQASGNGDPLPGGGRLVVADAATLKRIGSIDNIMFGDETKSADGRGLCGAGPGRVYMATTGGIYIIDIENVEVVGKIEGSNLEGSGLYNGQVGDMLLAGHHAFAVGQNKGLLIIDIDTDQIVKTIEDETIQGVAQAADGTVWYATNTSEFVAVNPETLEEIRRVAVPAECGKVECAWGSWRPTQFTGAQTVDCLFFCGGGGVTNGGSGNVWRFDTGSGEFTLLASIGKLDAHTPGFKQGAYGAIRYDDRTGEVIAGSTEYKASGHYRYNWTHYIDGAQGGIVRSVELRPYYWFQAVPVFPDACEPVMEDVEDIVLGLDDDPVEIVLNATDPDNHDSNIRFSLIEAEDVEESEAAVCRAPAASGVADVTLEGNRLKVAPLAEGPLTVGIAVESNGRMVRHAINIDIKTDTGIDGIDALCARIHAEGRAVVTEGLAGVTVRLVNALGAEVAVFTPDDDSYTVTPDVEAGVYVAVTDNGMAKKIILK